VSDLPRLSVRLLIASGWAQLGKGQIRPNTFAPMRFLHIHIF
jgi:hypothetical protein